MIRRASVRVVGSCLACVLAGALSGAHAAVQARDDLGGRVSLDRPAERILSLAPHLTELAFAAGAGQRLVGVVRDSDFPPQARSIPQVGDAAGVDFERVLALQPDLVLAWGSGSRASVVAKLRQLGLPVLVLEPRQLDDIPRHLELIGHLAGTTDESGRVAAAFRKRVASLRGRHGQGRTVNVMFEMWHRPIMTINGEHIISDVLALCGARNVFADLPQLAGEVSLEQVLVRNPEAIVVGSEAPGAGMADWRAYPYLQAVREGRVYNVAPDLINRQTPRMLDAAESICADVERVRRAQ